MFPEPPDPNKTLVKGVILLVVLLILYTFMKEGMRMMLERGSMVPPEEMLSKPSYMSEDGQKD